MVEGLSHITFVVRDLEKMSVLLKEVLEAQEVYASGDVRHSVSAEKFFIIGGVWVAVMEGDPISEQSYNHVAFKIPDMDFDMYVERVRRLGLDVREGRSRIAGEGRSLYFHDYDNHLFELHTGTLSQRLIAYANVDG